MRHLRHYLQEVSREQRLWAMFDTIPLHGNYTDPNERAVTERTYRKIIQKWIDFARTVLQREDRIIWFLRLCQKVILKDFDDPRSTRRREQLNVTVPEANSIVSPMGQDMLRHFFSLPIHAIQNYRFDRQNPNDVLRDFARFEQEWREQSTLANQLIPMDPNDGVVVAFPDGKKWFDLNRASCSTEAKVMGHCGNVGGDGKTMFSLREPVKVGKAVMWRPLLTFILHHDDRLGEMKGRGNDKPAKRYHRNIVAILKLPIIKGIRGGGYAPENNFALSDLTPAEQEEVVKANPRLTTFRQRIAVNGMSDEILSEIKEALSHYDLRIRSYDGNTEEFILTNYRSVKSAAENLVVDEDGRSRDSFVGWLAQVLSEQIEDQTDYEAGVHDDNLEEIIDKLKDEDFADLVAALQETYDEDVLEEYDLEDRRSVLQFIEEERDEVYDNLRNAAATGLEQGSHEEMARDLDRWLESLPNVANVTAHIVTPDGYGEVCELRVAAHDFIEKIDNIGSGPFYKWSEWLQVRDIIEPRSGYYGFDVEAALDYFLDEMPRPEEVVESRLLVLAGILKE